MALSLTHCVNRRCCQLSLKRCSPSKGGRNPTWAGPCLSRNPCSNFPHGKVCSQRRPVTGGDEGARQGQNGRGRVSAEAVCAKLLVVLKHRASFHPAKALAEESVTAISSVPHSEWRRHLFTMAGNTDR
jgi:hypothetical protein